ncbi:DUF3043 domain-containing protein [Pseudonocardia eucalypti]|uniref:DUF3043 domain-containing protein n=1 Tax=Pseudonocardia eucalypti TaxID=648755 RepID=A0ABP9R585_9PSEU|nr:hypothetical protein [Pseudonocardia eucalypti]
MRFLRRQSGSGDDAAVDAASTTDEGAEEVADTVGRGVTPGKGRATPKRRDAEGKRRGPAPPPPKTQREAIKLARKNRGTRAERRRESAERRSRMMAGDERALLPRDRGPVKAYVRDLVDSRRHLAGLFMPLAALVFLSLIAQSIPFVQAYTSIFCMAMLASMAIEGVMNGRRVVNKAREHFPNEQISPLGIGWYAFARASQLRKLRVPKPKVRPGDKVD